MSNLSMVVEDRGSSPYILLRKSEAYCMNYQGMLHLGRLINLPGRRFPLEFYFGNHVKFP